MDGDLVSLLIYVALGLIGVIASARKNKAKKQQQAQQRQNQVPRTFPADAEKDYGPELGPLMELFDIPRQKPEVTEYESVESGPSLEEEGMNVDTETGSVELQGLNMDSSKSMVEHPISEVESFEEGQSDIQKMIAKYDAIREKLEKEGLEDEIASGEIVSVEAEEAAREKRNRERDFFDLKKAIIYSEILKRREI